jgi:hypothetical protein
MDTWSKAPKLTGTIYAHNGTGLIFNLSPKGMADALVALQQ